MKHCVTEKIPFDHAKTLVEQPNSCFSELSKNRKIILPPKFIGKVKYGITQVLDLELNLFVDSLGGVPIAYNHIKRFDEYGSILENMPYLHFSIQADYIVFQPEKDAVLEGTVNKIGKGHIGLLVHNIFNASIKKSLTGHGDVGWPELNVSVGDKIVFKIHKIRNNDGVISLEGNPESSWLENHLNSAKSSKKRKREDSETQLDHSFDSMDLNASKFQLASPLKKKKKITETNDIKTVLHFDEPENSFIKNDLMNSSSSKRKKNIKLEHLNVSEAGDSTMAIGLDVSKNNLNDSTLSNSKNSKKKRKKKKLNESEMDISQNDSKVDVSQIDSKVDASILVSKSDVTNHDSILSSQSKKERKKKKIDHDHESEVDISKNDSYSLIDSKSELSSMLMSNVIPNDSSNSIKKKRKKKKMDHVNESVVEISHNDSKADVSRNDSECDVTKNDSKVDQHVSSSNDANVSQTNLLIQGILAKSRGQSIKKEVSTESMEISDSSETKSHKKKKKRKKDVSEMESGIISIKPEESWAADISATADMNMEPHNDVSNIVNGASSFVDDNSNSEAFEVSKKKKKRKHKNSLETVDLKTEPRTAADAEAKCLDIVKNLIARCKDITPVRRIDTDVTMDTGVVNKKKKKKHKKIKEEIS